MNNMMPYCPYIYIYMISMTIALFGCQKNAPRFQLPGADGLPARRPERARVGVVGMRDLPVGKPIRQFRYVLLFGEKTWKKSSDTKMEIAFEIRT